LSPEIFTPKIAPLKRDAPEFLPFWRGQILVRSKKYGINPDFYFCIYRICNK